MKRLLSDRWGGILGSPEYRHQKLVADAWCAAFVWPKEAGALADAAPTNELWRQLRDGHGKAPERTEKTIEEATERYRFFHWHLQFPQVLAKGGFDVVLGNPPWDALRLQEKEFFAASRPDIADAATSVGRKSAIAALALEDPNLYRRYKSELRFVEGANALVVASGAYPLCGVGRVNLFALFAEAARRLVGLRGRVGQILPAGIVADDSTKLFFQTLVDGRELASLFHFENEERIFAAVHHAFRFVLLVVDRSGSSARADLQFFARQVSDLSLDGRRFSLSAADFALFNPATRTCPIFRSRHDADLNIAIYRRAPVLTASGWKLALKFPLDVGRESSMFRHDCSESNENLLPLYEGKYFHQYDHRWLTREADGERVPTISERSDPAFQIRPRHWYPAPEAERRFGVNWSQSWVIAWRDIARSTDERTMIASVIPSLAVAHSAWLIILAQDELQLAPALLANINAFSLDYAVRQKVGGTHLSAFIVEQLPILGPHVYAKDAPWQRGTTLRDWIAVRVLELGYTAWELERFARAVGYAGAPFRWDLDRRFRLRCEVDAAFFHLYGLSRDDTDYVMETFFVTKKNDEKVHGEYRTKRVILETYDALARAVQSGKPYRTPLDPLPAAPGASHGTFTPNGTPRDYAEALRTGLLFTLIRRGGEEGVSSSILSRALLWLEDSKHAAPWLEGSALAEYERVRESDPLLAEGAADSQAMKLLEALETANAITRDAKGIARRRAGGSIPNWLPQTPTLTKLASVIRGALDQAEREACAPADEKVAAGTARRA